MITAEGLFEPSKPAINLGDWAATEEDVVNLKELRELVHDDDEFARLLLKEGLSAINVKLLFHYLGD